MRVIFLLKMTVALWAAYGSYYTPLQAKIYFHSGNYLHLHLRQSLTQKEPNFRISQTVKFLSKVAIMRNPPSPLVRKGEVN
jgi:hypothetical protein